MNGRMPGGMRRSIERIRERRNRGRVPGSRGEQIRRRLRRSLDGDIFPKPILKIISPADTITLLNFICGIGAVMFSGQGGDGLRIAMVLILMGLIFDGLDGPIARKFGSSHNFGKWLDSLADSVTFAIAPAFLIYNAFYPFEGSIFSSAQSILSVLAALFIVLLGILRLARFSLSGFRFKHFIGIPTPMMAMVAVGMVSFDLWSGRIGWEIDYVTSGDQVLIPAFLFLSSFLMVSDIMYRKYRGKLMILAAMIVLLMIFTLLMGSENPELGMTGTLIFTAAALGYMFSPLVHDPKHIWGASRRMKDELLLAEDESEGTAIDELIDDSERCTDHEIDDLF